MRGFTELERAACNAICDSCPDVAIPLRALLATALPFERDNTGHGFYTFFEVDKRMPPIALAERMLDGTTVEVAVGTDTLLLGFILWLEDGYPNCLEGFQYATTEGGNFDLKAIDLSLLTWLKPKS